MKVWNLSRTELLVKVRVLSNNGTDLKPANGKLSEYQKSTFSAQI